MRDTSNQEDRYIISLSDVSHMPDVLDCEVMHSVIVAETKSGLWYCQAYQNKGWSDMDDVPFYSALPWMKKRWGQITGTGVAHIENDQLEDERIARLSHVSHEEDRHTDIDYFGSQKKILNEVMPGAFGNEYANVEFSL